MTDIDPNLWASLAKTYMHGLTLPTVEQAGHLAYVNATGDNLEYEPVVPVLPAYSVATALQALRVNNVGEAVEWSGVTLEDSGIGLGGVGYVRVDGGELRLGLRPSTVDVDRLVIGLTAVYPATSITLGTLASPWTHGYFAGTVNTSSVAADSHVGVGTDPAHSGALRIANSEEIVARNAAGTADLALISLDSSNRPTVGSISASVTQIRAGSSVYLQTAGISRWYVNSSGAYQPAADGSYAVGTSANRVSAGHFSDFVAVGTDPAHSGAIRLANTGVIAARNAADTADITMLTATASNAVAFGAGGYNLRMRASTAATIQVGGTDRWSVTSAGHWVPAADEAYNVGAVALRVEDTFQVNAATVTSDAREKQDVLPIDDALLDAWADVSPVAFRWISSVSAKGDDARVHTGWIAQQVRDALAAHGVDGTRYGLLCHDEWEDQYEPDSDAIEAAAAETRAPRQRIRQMHAAGERFGEASATATQAHGRASQAHARLRARRTEDEPEGEEERAARASRLAAAKAHTEAADFAELEALEAEAEAYAEVEALGSEKDALDARAAAEAALASAQEPTVLTLAAGDRWGLRYTEALIVEAAYQRRRSDRIEARLEALEAPGNSARIRE